MQKGSGNVNEKGKKGGESARGLSDALVHVSKHWFPANPLVTNRIIEKLGRNEYTSGLEILEDIKLDFALLTYCLREANKLNPTSQKLDPLQLLQVFSIEEYQKLLSKPAEDISVHSIRSMTKTQALRFKHTIASAQLVELLAKKGDLDPTVAYCCAVLRQLGYNLLVWNYPHLYSRALTELRGSGSTFAQLLLRTVGFFPNTLVLKLTQSWGLSPTVSAVISAGVAGPRDVAEDAHLPEEAQQLIKLSEMGEMFGRANDLKHFPMDHRGWQKLVREISIYLGPAGLKTVREQMQDAFKTYEELNPEVFKSEDTDQHVDAISNKAIENMMAKNSYSKNVSSEMQRYLRSVYEQIKEGELSFEAIEMLLQDVIPFAGFPSGCLYFYESARSLLSPMMVIGKTDVMRYRQVSCHQAHAVRHPVVRALYSKMPIKEEEVLFDGDKLSHISGVVGRRDVEGVLFLEMSDKLRDAEIHEPILYFKAIRECLNEALGMA